MTKLVIIPSYHERVGCRLDGPCRRVAAVEERGLRALRLEPDLAPLVQGRWDPLPHREGVPLVGSLKT